MPLEQLLVGLVALLAAFDVATVLLVVVIIRRVHRSGLHVIVISRAPERPSIKSINATNVHSKNSSNPLCKDGPSLRILNFCP